MKLTSKESIRWIALSAFIVGTLDGLSAVIFYKADPVRLFQYIASGAIGNETAFSGGTATFLLGVLFHYFFATVWTILFFILYDKFRFVRKMRIVTGLLYGMMIWLVMNLVVVKLSRIHGPTPDFNQMLIGASILIFAIGIPVAFLAGRLDRNDKAARVHGITRINQR
jgi:hypothetical protein